MPQISKEVSKIIKNLSKRDIQALKSIYDLRCLTLEQIYFLHYSQSLKTNKEVSDAYCKKKIHDFLDYKIIEKVEYNDNNFCYFLSSLGIEIIRFFYNFPTNIYDLKKRVVRRGYFRASELKMGPRIINHQIYLNQFFIEFQSLGHDNTIWKYADGKHAENFVNIMPDAILTIYDSDFFVETDMGTESKKQLLEKWTHYRSFLRSREFSCSERKINVLFIIENVANIQERINLVKHTAYEVLMDISDERFDLYVGTKEEILQNLSEKLIPAAKKRCLYFNEIKELFIDKYDFNIIEGEKTREYFNGTHYLYFIRDNKIFPKYEFIVDEYFYSPFQVLNKIAFFESQNSLIKQKFNFKMKLIIVCNSIEEIYNDLKLVNLLSVNDIYYTTIDRLKNNSSLNEALFEFDTFGNIYHFKNMELQERIFEKEKPDIDDN